MVTKQESNRRWYIKNRSTILNQRAAMRRENPQIHQAHAEKHRLANLSIYAARAVCYRSAHPERIRKTKLKNYHKRIQQDLLFGLARRVRARIGTALKRAVVGKTTRTIDLLGCSPNHLKWYLERLFLPGMSWANRNLWHIDHKKPIASFDLSDNEQQRQAFHFSNCQPLWILDNLRKGARI